MCPCYVLLQGPGPGVGNGDASPPRVGGGPSSPPLTHMSDLQVLANALQAGGGGLTANGLQLSLGGGSSSSSILNAIISNLAEFQGAQGGPVGRSHPLAGSAGGSRDVGEDVRLMQAASGPAGGGSVRGASPAPGGTAGGAGLSTGLGAATAAAQDSQAAGRRGAFSIVVPQEVGAWGADVSGLTLPSVVVLNAQCWHGSSLCS